MTPITALRLNEEGATMVEFAAVLPLMCLAMLGGMDLVHREYAQSILTGNVQKVGRDSALQGGANAITVNDAKVKAAVREIAPEATVTFERTSVSQFRAIGGEAFSDTNNNGTRNAGECYDDSNGNKQWDANASKSGQGGADDVVLYKVTATYARLFPAAALLGWSENQTITAETALKNQPFSASSEVATICT